MRGSNPNTLWAEAFLDELVRAGVRHVVAAPGSRSTPLTLAASRRAPLRVTAVVDERSAGFLALGVGRATGRPAAVVTTSGTGAANLLPAVIEASQGEVPLLLLTADRPRRLTDTDGNQSMDQLRLFGAFPRAFFHVGPPEVEASSLDYLRSLAGRVVGLATGAPPGPVHLNFPFAKPLEPGESPGDLPPDLARAHPLSLAGRPGEEPMVRVPSWSFRVDEEEMDDLARLMAESGRGLVVAGPVPDPEVVGPRVLALAAAVGCPLLADPLSGARFRPAKGARVVAHYDLFLRSDELRRELAPDWILRIGGSPTSTAVLDLLSECREARQVVVDGGHRWKDQRARAHRYLRAAPGPVLERLLASPFQEADPGWLEGWAEAERRTQQVLDETGVVGGSAGGQEKDVLEGEILAAVAAAVPEDGRLFVGNSMPVRDLDAFAPPRDAAFEVFGNRGASGIDGLVSTTLGVALGSGAPTVGVLGDLSLFHDMNGLLCMRDLRLPVVLVVVNNDGGGIFHTLPVREFEPAFTELFVTPHGLDFRKVAELYRLPFHRAETVGELEDVLEETLARKDPLLLEIRTRGEESHARRREIVELVRRRVEEPG